jgi:PAS domain S-box-containing protein
VRNFGLDGLFAGAPYAMIAVEADGRICAANDQAVHLLGYTKAELESLPVESLVPDSARDGHARLRAGFAEVPDSRLMATGRELSVLDRDGNERPVEIGLMSITDDGRQLVIATLVDIADRLRAEQALQDQAVALARSNEELERFASIAAHDIRAPLRRIQLLAGSVLRRAVDDLPGTAREQLLVIEEQADRLEATLEGLLAYARVGQDQSSPQWVDPDTVLRSLADTYVPQDRFRVRIAEGCPPIFGPKALVELVFRNLLMNVVKHHDEPTGTITIAWHRDHRGLHFTVADDGPGIPAEHADRIFRLFSTVQPQDQSTTSGLGLALVLKAMETMNGRIELLHSPDHRGTTFLLSWPSGHLEGPPTGEAVAEAVAATGAPG